MAIRVRRVDTGAINTQAFNNFANTITQLKGQQRDREITTGLAKIERKSQLALDVVANDPILSDDDKLTEIQKVRQATRISKLDMLNQTGDFSPPQSRGIGGFLGRLAGAFDPTDTRGVTQSPMTQAVQGRLVQQNFPSPSEQARADSTRSYAGYRTRAATAAAAKTQAASDKALKARSPAILKEITSLENAMLESVDEDLNELRQERIDSLKKEYNGLNPRPGQAPNAVTGAAIPAPKFTPAQNTATQTERIIVNPTTGERRKWDGSKWVTL